MNLIPSAPSDNFGFYANFGDFVHGVFRSAMNDSRAIIYKHDVYVHDGRAVDEKSRGTSGFIGKVDEGKARIGTIHLRVKPLPGHYYLEDGGSLILAHEVVSCDDGGGYHYRVGAAISAYKEEFMTDEKFDMLAQFIRDQRESISLPMDFEKLLEDDRRLSDACRRLDKAAELAANEAEAAEAAKEAARAARRARRAKKPAAAKR